MDMVHTGFNPTFTRVHSIDECADLINLPHEDYPQRVGVTAEAITYHVDAGTKYLTDQMYKAIHSYIMYDIRSDWRGQWRNIDVTVGYDSPPPPFMIQGEIEEHGLNIIKFKDIQDESDIIRWYRALMIVHPFADGNGRVGGVIAAVASHNFFNDGSMLAPCQ